MFLKGLHLLLNIFICLEELLHVRFTLGKNTVHTLLGLLRGEYIALITSVRILPALSITGLLEKETVALGAVVDIGIFLPVLARFCLLIFLMNPRYHFDVGV